MHTSLARASTLSWDSLEDKYIEVVSAFIAVLNHLETSPKLNESSTLKFNNIAPLILAITWCHHSIQLKRFIMSCRSIH